MAFNIDDKILAQLFDVNGKHKTPLFSGTVVAVNGSVCSIKWANSAVAACAHNAFRSNEVDEKYLILA